jgi:GT2 family glycosyltransferase
VFERISIGIKTFLRDEKLFLALASIYKALPDAHIIIADDGEMSNVKAICYDRFQEDGHTVIQLPFDNGFGKKSNAIINNLERDYLLVASDDFDFSAPDVVVGVEKMLAVLDQNPELSIVSGRLRNRGPYEFYFHENARIIHEVPCNFDSYLDGFKWGECDVTFNYSLIRKEVFEKIKFDDEEIIGEGGHGAFFYDVKKAGLKVGYVPGVYIDEMTGRDSDRYRQYRNRACGPSRKCFEKRGIKKYVLGDGRVDYERKEQ